METRRFALRDVLTVTTNRLLTKSNDVGNGIENLYALLGWMTNDEPFTHQLPRFADECKPWLLRWFPELAAAAQALLPELDAAFSRSAPDTNEAALQKWLTRVMESGCKESYEVPKIPADDHERKHPVDELIAMRGTDEGIILVEIPQSSQE